MRLGLREFIFLIVLLAMPISSFWFVFRPQNAEIRQARSEIEHKERMLEKLAEATSRNADLERANADIAAGIELIESRLPSTKEVDVVLEQVSTLAREHTLDMPKVRSEKPVQSSKYMEQPLEMKITGNFDDFYEFMLSLEGLQRITRMTDLKIRKLDDVDGSMEASFTLAIYFEPDSTGGAK